MSTLLKCEMLIMGEAVHVWGKGNLWEISVPQAQFFCQSKSVKIKNSIKKNGPAD